MCVVTRTKKKGRKLLPQYLKACMCNPGSAPHAPLVAPIHSFNANHSNPIPDALTDCAVSILIPVVLIQSIQLPAHSHLIRTSKSPPSLVPLRHTPHNHPPNGCRNWWPVLPSTVLEAQIQIAEEENYAASLGQGLWGAECFLVDHVEEGKGGAESGEGEESGDFFVEVEE